MPHGAELSTVTVTVVTAAELPASCNSDALGCYRPGEITIADEVLGGVTPEEVARHEYGHHVAASRLNSPWPALDWGPKRWATVAHVCGDVTVGSAHPGDEGDHYSENPAEAWAEVYRILAERTAGLPGNTWSIVVGRYFPDEAVLAAAREDVVHPWTAPTTRRFSGTFTKTGKRQWLRTLATPLDGNITVKLSMPGGTRHDVTLLAANGRTVLAHWTGVHEHDANDHDHRLRTAVGGAAGHPRQPAEPVLGRRDLGLTRRGRRLQAPRTRAMRYRPT